MANTTGGTTLKLTFDIGGLEGGDPMVLLHAIGTNRSLWDPQWEAWCAQYKVIRCDLPGHGSTPVSSQPETMFTLAKAVDEVIDKLGVGPAHVVGSSLGGMIGLALAIDHPGSVRSLVAADVRADAPDEYKTMWDGLISRADNEGMGAIAEFMIGRWFGEGAQERGDEIAAVANMLETTPVEGFIASAQAIQKMDFAGQVGEINCPTLLLAGENDGVLPKLMLEMSHDIQGSEYVGIKAAGHLPNIEQPDRFISAVNGFLEGQA